MILILELIALGIFALIAVNLWNGMRRGRDIAQGDGGGPQYTGALPTRDEAKVPLPEAAPAARAAVLLRDFENVRAELKGRYPATFSMLGGYLNNHTIAEHGGLEGAVREMIADWTPRRDEAMREITKLLAENETEEEVRAIVTAACDADFNQEGYRSWLTWLLGRLNAL